MKQRVRTHVAQLVEQWSFKPVVPGSSPGVVKCCVVLLPVFSASVLNFVCSEYIFALSVKLILVCINCEVEATEVEKKWKK